MFSKILGLVPSYGVNNWKGYIGPVIVSALFSLAYVVRLMRTSTPDVLNQDYIRTARAKGLPEWKVLESTPCETRSFPWSPTSDPCSRL